MVSRCNLGTADGGVPGAMVRGPELFDTGGHRGAAGHHHGLRGTTHSGQDLPRDRLDRREGEEAGPVLPEPGQCDVEFYSSATIIFLFIEPVSSR